MTSSLRQKTLKGFLWQSAGTVGTGIVGMIVTMLLAHYLTPNDFGIIEIILSFVVISEVLVDSGFSQAIIREKDLDNRDLTSVFIINLLISSLIYISLFFLAPVIASYYGLPFSFVYLFRVLNIKIIIDAFSFSQVANCIRQMQFQVIAQASIIAITIAGLASILMVYLNYGIWALVIYYLLLSTSKTIIINYKVRWKPSFEFRINKIKEFIKFGSNLMIVQLLDRSVTSFESLCVGKAYTKSDLGNFSQARKLDALIIQTLLGVVQKVSYPSLAKIETDEHLKSVYKEIMQLAFWVVFPIATFCCFNSGVVMCALFGRQWEQAAPFLSIFSVYSMIYPIQAIGMNIFMIKKKTGMLRNINVFKQLVRVITILILVHSSMYCFTIGIVAVAVVSAILYLYFGGKLIDYSISSILFDNFKSLISAILSAVISYLAVKYVQFSIFIELIISAMVFSLIYVALTGLINKVVFNRIFGIVSYLKHKP